MDTPVAKSLSHIKEYTLLKVPILSLVLSLTVHPVSTRVKAEAKDSTSTAHQAGTEPGQDQGVGPLSHHPQTNIEFVPPPCLCTIGVELF